MSVILCLGEGLRLKIDEKALLEDSVGTDVVTDIGRCIEKKDDM